MTWKLAEYPAKLMAAYIEDSQAAKLANIEDRAEYADSPMPLPSFVAIRHHEPWRNPEAQYPMLYIRPIRSRLRPGPAGLARGHIGQHDYMVAVICVASGGPGAAIDMVQRYMVALMEMIAEYFDADAGRTIEWGMVNDTEILYEPLETNGVGEFAADARMLITAQVSEGAL